MKILPTNSILITIFRKNTSIPYINKISEKFMTIGKKHELNIVYKPINLNQHIKSGKDKS